MSHRHVRSAALVALALGVAAFGATTANAGSAKVTPPASIKSANQLLFCSDITYPPEEFYKGTTPAGSDIEIGDALAAQMGVKASFQNTGFDGIIPALEGKKCDAIISGMNDTPARRKQVDFTDYISVGQSFMVKKGNPEHITNIASLAGKTVSVEVGTTNADYLNAQSKKLQAAGKKRSRSRRSPRTPTPRTRWRPTRSTRTSATRRSSRTTSASSRASSSSAARQSIRSRWASRRARATPLTAAMKKAVANIYANGTMKQDPRQVEDVRHGAQALTRLTCSSHPSTGTCSSTT